MLIKAAGGRLAATADDDEEDDDDVCLCVCLCVCGPIFVCDLVFAVNSFESSYFV